MEKIRIRDHEYPVNDRVRESEYMNSYLLRWNNEQSFEFEGYTEDVVNAWIYYITYTPYNMKSLPSFEEVINFGQYILHRQFIDDFINFFVESININNVYLTSLTISDMFKTFSEMLDYYFNECLPHKAFKIAEVFFYNGKNIDFKYENYPYFINIKNKEKIFKYISNRTKHSFKFQSLNERFIYIYQNPYYIEKIYLENGHKNVDIQSTDGSEESFYIDNKLTYLFKNNIDNFYLQNINFIQKSPTYIVIQNVIKIILPVINIRHVQPINSGKLPIIKLPDETVYNINHYYTFHYQDNNGYEDFQVFFNNEDQLLIAEQFDEGLYIYIPFFLYISHNYDEIRYNNKKYKFNKYGVMIESY